MAQLKPTRASQRGTKARHRVLTPVEMVNLMATLGEAGQLVMQVGFVMNQGFGRKWVSKMKSINTRIVSAQAGIADAFREKHGYELEIEKPNPDTRRKIF